MVGTNFTAALELTNGLHITLCFCPATGKKGKIETWSGESTAKVVGVEYWEVPDITVLIMNCDLALERHDYYKSNGYEYDLEFKPHSTVGRGNVVKEFEGMIGAKTVVCGEYIRLFQST